MARRNMCLVASDEEDEDGNLSETTNASEGKSIPIGEVVYLPEDTSNLQPEDSETDQQHQVKVSSQRIKVKTIDSLRKAPGDRDNNVDATKLKSNTSEGNKNHVSVHSSSEKESNNANTGNITTKSGTLKAADLMPPPLKKGCASVSQNNFLKKAKYARQATPICDAIMKEYSKRQKMMKQKGNLGSLEVSDMPIQELLKKAKEKEASRKKEINTKSTDENTQTAKLNVLNKDSLSNESNDSDPLTIVKQEIIDIKPEEIYIPVDSAEIKQEQVHLSNVNITNSKTAKGRGRGRPSKGGQQRKRKCRISDDEDDSDDDPDFDPIVEKGKSKRVTRYSSRTTLNHAPVSNKKNSGSQEKNTVDIDKVNTPGTLPNEENQSGCALPKDIAINVAERLKSLAEKIADVLTKESSPNIDSEAENLLHATQELIELQRKTLKNKNRPSPETTQPIKQEIIDPPDNSKDISSESPIAASGSSQISTEHSLHIYNQLQRHEAALQKKLSESVFNSDQVSNHTKTVPSLNLSSTGNITSGSVSLQEKCTFIMDFFTSFKEVFDEYIVNQAIPVLSDNVLICVNELSECVQRTKKAQTLKNKVMKDQEINLARQSYLKTIMSAGEKFFPWFNHVIDKITKTKTSKALVSTLILYIAGSLFVKTPKLRNQMHRLRRVLLFMSKAHLHSHPLVNQVLQTPNDVFDCETKLIRHMLKYFQVRKFLNVPVELLCNFPDDSIEEEQQFQTELSVMDTAILKHVDSFGSVSGGPAENKLNQNYSRQFENPSPSVSSFKTQSRLSNITSEFIEALQSERDGNTKRIEEKLDYILNVLSGNSECLRSSLNNPTKNLTDPHLKLEKGVTDIQKFNVKVNLGQRVPNVPTVKLNSNWSQKIYTEVPMSSRNMRNNNQPVSLPNEKGILLAQLFEDDNAGMDSLFSSYLKSRKEEPPVKVKSEPLDVPEKSNESSAILPQPVFISVKQEPNDNAPDYNRQSLLEDAIFEESFTEEYNFAKEEKDFFDTDSFS